MTVIDPGPDLHEHGDPDRGDAVRRADPTGRGRIVFLVTSPRLPAGLLTLAAWDCLRAGAVRAGAEGPQVAAIRAAGIPVDVVDPTADTLLAELRQHPTLVWLAEPAGNPDLARDLGFRLARDPGQAELELMYGSWDPPGARLLDVVTVVDQLAAPGGDPWLNRYAALGPDGVADHDGLARYLLEEAYEAYDAMRSGQMSSLREELGDVLFQVILHSRIGVAAAREPFTVDDVAGDLVAKLIRRNPHVFAGAEVTDLEEITRNWERIKQSEKARRSPVDGIALSQPALSLAAQLLARLARTATPSPEIGPDRDSTSEPETERGGEPLPTPGTPEPLTGGQVARQLFSLVQRATDAGVDAEAALRALLLDQIQALADA